MRATKIKPSDSPNVPAFQRKRSLAAKARRCRKPATAFERKEAGVPVVKPKVCRRRVVRASGFVGVRGGERLVGGSAGSFSSPIVDSYDEPGYDEPGYSSSGSSEGSDPAVREMALCGVVEAFFDKIDVVAVQVSSSIRVGDRLVFETRGGLFEQEIDSMQINREDVMTAYNGDDVGIKVVMEPVKGGNVYKVI